MDTVRTEVQSYSGLHRAVVDVCAPNDEEELRECFRRARQEKRRISFRTGGHCFDDQSINDDLIVSLRRFDKIEVDVEKLEMTVGSGVCWGEVIKKLEPLGLVPFVTVTTSRASLGGTLSGDCLSRFSPSYGKEGHYLRRFRMMTVDGEARECGDTDGRPTNLCERLFCGAVGGLGYLGAVTEMTYRLLPVGQTDGRIGVETTIKKFRSFAALARELVPVAKEMYQAPLEKDTRRTAPQIKDALYSALYTDFESEYALLLRSRYTRTRERRRFLLHQPYTPLRPITEWAMRVPWVNRLLWRLYYASFRDGQTFIDDLGGYTFFMDGNVRSKELGEELGAEMITLQQTFVVPARSHPGESRWEDDIYERLMIFFEVAKERFKKDDLTPTMFDVLFLPEDERFHLSASAEMAGFAVSFAFETSNKQRLAKIAQAFEDLADLCWEKVEGRVYLVKNVRCKPVTLAKMYGPSLDAFFALKREVDPEAVLRNAFLERNFGTYLLKYGLVR
jgi:decaprenylphospho-beta-D-ribofuranose 2-oxidase